MKKLFKYFLPYRWLGITALLMVFIQAMSELFLPNLMSKIVNIGIVTGDTGYIVKVGGQMLLVALLGTACSVFGSFCASRASMGFGRDIREKVFTKVESFSQQEFDKFGASTLITRSINDIGQVQQTFFMGMRMLARSPMMFIGGIIMAVYTDVKLSFILLVSLPLIAIIIITTSKRTIPLFSIVQKKIDNLNKVLRENLIGIRVVRAFNKVDYEKERFDNANFDLTETSLKTARIMAYMMPLMSLVMNYTTLAIIWFAGIRIDSAEMNVGNLMAFVQYVSQIMFSLFMVSMIFNILPRAFISSKRINEVLETTPEIKDTIAPEEIKNKKGTVRFEKVYFNYPGAEHPVLSDISFEASPGEITAVIGGTGSGKSTLVNLIPRFYDVEKGSISVDGVDIRLLRQTDLRDMIGFISQSAVLFSGTVAENIKLGKLDAPEEEVEKAAEIAQALEFINQKEDKFDSYIAQGGTNVSGGQKQRISIARAIVKKPLIYIFDDSFSALDFKTDAKLRAALKDEIINSTVFIVAQRVSTILDADRIIVLDEGKIAGIGKHSELIKSCEIYREIVSSQLSEEELA